MKEFITDNAIDAIIVIDLHGKVNYCNKTACEVLGFTAGQLVGKAYGTLLPSGTTMSFDKVCEKYTFQRAPGALPYRAPY